MAFLQRSGSLPTLAEGEALDLTKTRSLFEDTPAARRRLVLTLYATALPGFVGSMLFLGGGNGDPRPLAAVLVLVLVGALWVYLRRNPTTWDWIFPVALGPTFCVGIAYATSGNTGDAYLALVGAPLACAAALFEFPVVLSALAAVIATVVLSLSVQMSVGAATVSTLLLAPAAAIAGWVIYSSANQFRLARRELQRLGQRDQALLRSLPDTLARVDREGRVLDIHVPSREGGPIAREDVVGRAIQDLVPGREATGIREAVSRAFATDEPQQIEYAGPGLEGERSYEARLHRSGSDEVTVIRRDITDRRRADEERRFSDALLGRMQEAVVAVDLNLDVVKWTGGAERIYGWTEAEAIGKPIASLVQPDLGGPDAAAFAANLAWRGTDHAVVRQRRKDGSPIVVDSNVAALHDATGSLKGYLAVCRDVTVQKKAELALREGAARLRAYFESPAVGIAITSPEKGWIEVNDQISSMLGYSREELSRLTWLDLTHPDDAAANLTLFESLLAGERESYSLDKRFIRKDGTTFWCLVSASCVRRPAGSVKYIVSIYIDIEKRRQAEEALRQSEHWLRLSQEIARIGHYVYDVQRDHWESSAALDAIFGIDASFPRKAADWIWLVHPDDRDGMREYLGKLLASGTRFDREYRIVNQATGAACWVHGLGEMDRGPEGEPVRLVGTIQDVHSHKAAEVERNALQAKLALSSRLAAMGTLVAGVAHEINNPLAAEIASQEHALASVREARRRLGAGEGLDLEAEARLLGDVIECLEDAQEAGQRVARIVRDMAAFARPDSVRTRVRLRDVADDALRWVPKALALTADIEVEDRGAPDVKASAGQLTQVVLNLLTNALKATRPGSRGKVALRLRTGDEGQATLEVGDQGVGIAPEIRGRIFEPFFTTRPAGAGRGTGLGLAVCHSIVASHGGTITVESEVGKGSRFVVELPAAPADA